MAANQFAKTTGLTHPNPSLEREGLSSSHPFGRNSASSQAVPSPVRSSFG
jgi:hypothetical protein